MVYDLMRYVTIGGVPVRTTVNIDDQVLAKAQRLTGVREKAALVREGLRALIEQERARPHTGAGDPWSTRLRTIVIVSSTRKLSLQQPLRTDRMLPSARHRP